MKHRTVLLKETLEWLDPQPGRRYVDMTLGGGGLSRQLLDAVAPLGFVFGIDRDSELLEETLGEMRREGYGDDRFSAKAGSFADIDHLLGRDHLVGYDGFAMDLGVSSPHFDRPDRGFSFREPGPLDMRFDRTTGQPLSRLLEDLDEERLRRILKEFGEERFAGRIARAVLRARDEERLTDTVALAIVIREAYPARARYESAIDPATRSFQALRIFVNDELRQVRTALMKTLNAMRPGARLAVISFHSLEDRMVKRLFRAVSEGERDFYGHRLPAGARELTRKPVTPAPVEAAINPRARSAKMRVIEKLDAGQIVNNDAGAGA